MKTSLKPEATVFLVITSAVLIDGQIARKDDLVEVTEREAKPLLERGKARLATADEAPTPDELNQEEELAPTPAPTKAPKAKK